MAVHPASEVPSETLGAFLHASFGAVKAEFLLRHGAWLYRGEENRWALLVDGEMAGYCGVIPTGCMVGGQRRQALWWVDLVIAPEFRGRGLQTRFDELVRSRNALLLGFPNELAAKIHRRHGWGVREDQRTLLMPLRPHRLRQVRHAGGLRGRLLRAGAQATRPLGALLRAYLGAFRETRAARIEDPDFDQMAECATASPDPLAIGTWRDADYLRWRYGAAPQRLLFYGTARPQPGDSRVYLVARRIGSGSAQAERWLDLFGDLDDRNALREVVRCAAREAATAGVAQITVLAANRRLRAELRRCGFLLSAVARFCWLDDDPAIMKQMGEGRHHWCFGDSDHDEPDDES